MAAKLKYTDTERSHDYKALFGSPLGQKVLSDILYHADVFDPIGLPWPARQISVEESLRREGARQLALHIAEFVRWDAGRFVEQWRNTEEVT